MDPEAPSIVQCSTSSLRYGIKTSAACGVLGQLLGKQSVPKMAGAETPEDGLMLAGEKNLQSGILM